MKVLVCGSRCWTDRNAIRRELDKLSEGTVVIHGFAPNLGKSIGTEDVVKRAMKNGVNVKVFSR